MISNDNESNLLKSRIIILTLFNIATRIIVFFKSPIKVTRNI